MSGAGSPLLLKMAAPVVAIFVFRVGFAPADDGDEFRDQRKVCI
tara:strand:+ start:868 stop:999 length:132 start_codon:yes stop_codon:yes gene_type:complete